MQSFAALRTGMECRKEAQEASSPSTGQKANVVPNEECAGHTPQHSHTTQIKTWRGLWSANATPTVSPEVSGISRNAGTAAPENAELGHS